MSENKIKIWTPHEGFQSRFVQSNVDFLVGGSAMGAGKEQPLDAKVLTPSGWTRMGDLRMGDLVVTPFDEDAPVTGIYPQGIKPVYRLTTADGRKCECGIEHLWAVRTKYGLSAYKKSGRYEAGLKVISTKEVMNLMESGQSVYIPLPSALVLSRKNHEFGRTRDHVRIESIEYVRDAECQCIVVDSPKHLYITDDYIVTHNSVGALLMAAEHTEDPNFRMVFLRRNIGDLRAGGGGTDEASKIYGEVATVKISENPRFTFPSGAFIDFTHMSDQREDKVLERVKGWQYSCIYVDEATGFEWSTIRLLMSRNRSQAKWSGKMRLTCNPKRNHWLRKWVDWYVDDQGYPIPERDGVVRYFFVNGKDVDDVVFGDTPEDVYRQCKGAIDSILRGQGDDYTYTDIVKSTTFLSGKLAENTSLMKDNASYLGSVAAMGEKQRQANLMGCWNVDLDEDLDTPISPGAARGVVYNEPQTSGIKWLTADLADVGTDNTFILIWDGYHIIDYKILPVATTDKNVEWIKRMALMHDIPDSHIIFDARRSPYMHERIPEAIAYDSSYAPRGLYKRNFMMLKDEVYMRLVEAVNGGRISMDERVAESTYVHQKLTSEISILEEFAEECAVVQFNTAPSGKMRLMSKKEMNTQLGKSRSMDVLDPCAMRFYPDLYSEYGQELAHERQCMEEEKERVGSNYVDIYDDTTWA